MSSAEQDLPVRQSETPHERKGSAAALFLTRFAILTPCIKDSCLTPGSQRVIHTQNLCVQMFLASSFMPARILQLSRQLHNNTIKSAIVTPDNSIMILPHCNVHALPVDPLRPRRVKMKIFNLQEPLSRDTGDQPINKYTTFNMEMSHTQEHQPFARENPNPCKLAPYGITHD